MRVVALKVVALLSVLAVAGCSDLARTTEPSTRALKPQSASANAVSTREELVPTSPILNPCNGEIIEGSAELHIVEGTTKNGGFDRIDYDFDGTGDVTGSEYHGHVTFTDFGTSNQNGTTVESSTTRIHIIGQGQAPDFFSDATFRTVISASGQEHDIALSNARCQD